MKGLALGGATLIIAGISLFLAGAFVWTNNARHGSISPAVYAGPCIAIVGVLLLIVSAVGAWKKR